MELFVNNIDKSMEFYSNVLGFNLPKDTNKNYIPVRRGDVVLGLGEMENLPREHPLRVHEGQSVGLGIEIVLEGDNIKYFNYDVVEKRYAIQNKINKRPWWLMDFRIIDTEVYYIRITS